MGVVERPLVVLFDDGLGRFGPLTDLRASFELRVGRLTAVERVRPDALWARPEHAALLATRHSTTVNALPSDATRVMLLNGRARPEFPSPPGGEGKSTVVVDAATGAVVVAHLRTRAEALRLLEDGEQPKDAEVITVSGPCLFDRPWQILEPDGLGRRMAADAQLGTSEWQTGAPRAVDVFGNAPLRIHPEARVLPGCIIDLELGPVTIDAHAIIRPGTVIVGPCSIGPHAIVAERSLIKPRTVIGPNCRAAGEIGNTIFQGFSNKAHDGHLGDSFIGEWVNLGAGTTNSNLLNTYGEVTMRLEADAPIERSGRQFLGAIVGDHVKTAILTKLPTGCVLGTGAMIAASGFAPTLVPRFAWLTDEGRRLYRFDKFIEVARAMWKRRNIEPTSAMIEALRSLHSRAASAFDGSTMRAEGPGTRSAS